MSLIPEEILSGAHQCRSWLPSEATQGKKLRVRDRCSLSSTRYSLRGRTERGRGASLGHAQLPWVLTESLPGTT